MIITKKLRKRVRRLAKWIAEEKNLPKSRLVVHQYKYKDKDKMYAVQGETEKGVYKYLISALHKEEISIKLFNHLYNINEVNSKQEKVIDPTGDYVNENIL